LFNVLIWFPVLALVVVSGMMYRQRAYRELPFFFLYVVSAPLIGVLRYSAFHIGESTYFFVYWISELTGAVFVTLALYEIFLRRLFPGFHKVRFYRHLFPMAAAIVLLLTVIIAAEATDRRAAFQAASRGADFIRTAILVFFVALMAFMGREWRRYDFGIALGFGFQAAAALADTAVRSRLHYRPPGLDTVEFIAYNISCLIWLITFLKPEKPLPEVPFAAETLHEAKKWEETMKDFLTHNKR
jgi:hypothetical protein